MEKTLVDFVKVLRTAEVKVSPAETLDAMSALPIVGYEDRTLFKNALSILLSKNPEEKEAFAQLDKLWELGVNFIDTAELYPVAFNYGEICIGMRNGQIALLQHDVESAFSCSHP